MLPVYLSANHISRFNNSGAGGGGGGGGSASGLLDAVFHNCMFWCTIYLKRELDEPYSAKPAQRSRLYRPARLHRIDTVPAYIGRLTGLYGNSAELTVRFV